MHTSDDKSSPTNGATPSARNEKRNNDDDVSLVIVFFCLVIFSVWNHFFPNYAESERRNYRLAIIFHCNANNIYNIYYWVFLGRFWSRRSVADRRWIRQISEEIIVARVLTSMPAMWLLCIQSTIYGLHTTTLVQNSWSRRTGYFSKKASSYSHHTSGAYSTDWSWVF